MYCSFRNSLARYNGGSLSQNRHATYIQVTERASENTSGHQETTETARVEQQRIMSTNQGLLSEIESQLARQLCWRRIMSGAYFVTSAVAIVCAGAATIVSGIGHAEVGAVLAGTATVLLGIEKGMMFREKWAFHLSTYARLDALRIEYSNGAISDENAVKRLSEIICNYATDLPIDRRNTSAS